MSRFPRSLCHNPVPENSAAGLTPEIGSGRAMLEAHTEAHIGGVKPRVRVIASGWRGSRYRALIHDGRKCLIRSRATGSLGKDSQEKDRPIMRATRILCENPHKVSPVLRFSCSDEERSDETTHSHLRSNQINPGFPTGERVLKSKKHGRHSMRPRVKHSTI